MTALDGDRPDPEALLARLRHQEAGGSRGHLRIYLGAFPGVGKTFAMLNEAHRRLKYGEDVVVGYAETHGRPATAQQLEGLEIVPRRRIDYRGVVVEELDVNAVLQRRPAVVLVDELAHTNAPGSEREKRWEDVQIILDAGISVVSTLNVQHLESLNDTVVAITGIRVRETIPDAVLDKADEVILVDLTPEGARARMEHGNVYPREQAQKALEGFFKVENLAALRDLALRRTTQEVDEQLEELMRETGRSQALPERILVLIDGSAASQALLRQAWRLAQGLDGELIVAYDRDAATPAQPTLDLAEDLNGRLLPFGGDDLTSGLTSLLEAESISHVVLAASPRRVLFGWRKVDIVDALLGEGGRVMIHVVKA